MLTQSLLPFPPPIPRSTFRSVALPPLFPLSLSLSHRKPRSLLWSKSKGFEAAAAENAEPTGKKAILFAKRKEKIEIPEYTDGRGRAFRIDEFLSHPSGVKTLINSRALQCFESLGDNTYRCTLHKVRFLKFEVVPVVDLRVTPTSKDCTVEMLSCRFEGSKAVARQNNLFSAFMRNHITWEANESESSLEVDVILKITLEVYTKPFSLLPISVVEKPGNLAMQGLINRLVPLLLEQLLTDYRAWVEEQLEPCSDSC